MNGCRFPAAGWPALLAAVLALAGCPYDSELPLGNPADAIADPALAGTWEHARAGEEFRLTIQRDDGAGYRFTAESDEEKESETYEGFVADVEGERFLNLRETPVSPGEDWVLVNYRIEGERLRLRIVDDALFAGRSFASTEELRDFIRAHLQDPRLYGDEAGSGWDWELERPLP